VKFKIGDKVVFEDGNYILALFVSDTLCNISNGICNIQVPISKLKNYSEKHVEVHKRLRTNEALEEDLDIARKNHVEAEVDLVKAREEIKELTRKLALITAAVADSLSRFEDSENPFYLGIKTLKGILK